MRLHGPMASPVVTAATPAATACARPRCVDLPHHVAAWQIHPLHAVATPSPLGRLIHHSGEEISEREQRGVGCGSGRLNAGREATLGKQHELGIRRNLW